MTENMVTDPDVAFWNEMTARTVLAGMGWREQTYVFSKAQDLWLARLDEAELPTADEAKQLASRIVTEWQA
jgi:hypothetical protein